MIRENMWFQLILFLIFVCSGIFYLIRGVKKDDKKRLMAGVLLLTFGWTKAVLLLKRWDINPFPKIALDVSEIIVTLASIILVAIYMRKWRSYIIGFGFLLVISVGVTYFCISARGIKEESKVIEKPIQ